MVKEVDPSTTQETLSELTIRLLLELKYTIVNERIESMKKMLLDAQNKGDWELQRTILEQQPQLMFIRQQLCQALGNRVIVK